LLGVDALLGKVVFEVVLAVVVELAGYVLLVELTGDELFWVDVLLVGEEVEFYYGSSSSYSSSSSSSSSTSTSLS